MPYPLTDPFYNPYGPVTTFAEKGVQPPAAQYIGPSDQLQLTVLSPNVDSAFVLGLRLLDLKGQVMPLAFNIIVPATGATPFVEVITPGECFLLSAVIDQANVRRGQCFCKLNLQQGRPMGGPAVGMVLISGYATATDTIGFPQSRAEDSLDGRGASLVYTGATPAVGVAPTLTVPPATRWRIFDVSLTLPAPIARNGSIILQAQTAGAAVKILGLQNETFLQDAAGNELYDFFNAGFGTLPVDMPFIAGDVLSATDSRGINPLLQFSALSASVEEFVQL